MPVEVVRSAATRLFESGFLKDKAAIVWHSGEPLAVGIDHVREAIAAISDCAQHYDIDRDCYQFGIQTNATLINDRWISLFREHDFRVGVSVDGPQFIHDRNRVSRAGLGTFARTLAGLRLVRQHNLHLNVICVLTDYSLDFPDEIFQFFVDERVPYVGFNIDEIEGANTCSTFDYSQRAKDRFTSFMGRMWDLVSASRAFRVREFDYTQGLILGTQSFAHNEARPFSIVSVDYQGHVCTFSPELHGTQSEYYSHFIIGNVLTDTFSQMARSQQFQKLNAEVERGRTRCRKECCYYKVCGGGSCSNKYFEHGTFDATETQYCRLARQAMADVVFSKMESELKPADV